MKRKKRVKKILLSEIKYLPRDREQLLEFVYGFKTARLPIKKTSFRKKEIPSFFEYIRSFTKEITEHRDEPVSVKISMQINQTYQKYYNAKRRFAQVESFYTPEADELERGLDELAEIAVTIECGKLYKKRKSLLTPECLDLSSFLHGEKAYNGYFNGGVVSVVNFDKYAYILDEIDKAVKSHIEIGQQKQTYKRMFYIHVGKTNSGKTYTSLQMLKNAKKGAYLSPLRLLALEVSDTLIGDGVPCSFVTGEEERRIKDANHVASTVELADYSTDYDVVVIDECQMISDYSRGYAWTKAIINMHAREICLCTAPEAVDVLVKLIDSCGDYYEIIRHRRTTPLVVEDKHFTLDDVQPGDALVAFSKQKVNAIGAQLIKRGINVSVLYGALPYEARKRQFESFIDGTSSVLVTTDAIGMGVNLPVRRIVFMEMYKFDGENVRLLSSGEVKQIAGRAGRRGKFDVGYVNTIGAKELEFVRKRLNSRTERVDGICVNFPKRILNDDYISLEDAFEAWFCYELSDFYVKESLEEAGGKIGYIRKVYNRLGIKPDKVALFEMATMPIDIRNVSVRKLWLRYIEQRLTNTGELTKPSPEGKTVEKYLTYSKMLDTYFLCSRSWDMPFDGKWLEKQRKKCNAVLIDGLIEDVESYTRYCKGCGKMLEWNHGGSRYCEACADKYEKVE